MMLHIKPRYPNLFKDFEFLKCDQLRELTKEKPFTLYMLADITSQLNEQGVLQIPEKELKSRLRTTLGLSRWTVKAQESLDALFEASFLEEALGIYQGGKKKTEQVVRFPSEAREIANHLHEKLQNRGVTHFPPKFWEVNVQVAARMLQNIPMENLLNGIDWLMNDDLLGPHITSMIAVEKHFPRYQMKAPKAQAEPVLKVNPLTQQRVLLQNKCFYAGFLGTNDVPRPEWIEEPLVRQFIETYLKEDPSIREYDAWREALEAYDATK